MRKSIAKKARLPIVQIAKILRAELPANFRVPGERARSGARDIDQNAIERAFECKRLRAVKDDCLHVSYAGAFESLAHRARAMRVQISGDDMALWPGIVRQEQGLAARRRA
jgi:hypothetical protein